MLLSDPEVIAMSSEELARPPLRTRAFELALRTARRSLARRSRLMRLVLHASRRLARREAALVQVRDDLYTLLRMVQAWMRREYRVVPWRSLLYGVAALAYFVNPADLLPDALLGLGLVDDVAVIAAVARAIQTDLERFRQWEALRSRTNGNESA
ncbi:YkvA family protein [Rhodothermus marinus]|uniref:YkvA family protein n=1 Tax=Rhodothermus marinus TaxID=29549 RepID=UPI0037CA1593